MNDRVIRRQRKLSMLYNLVVFTVIFSVFGAILYFQLHAQLFAEVDELFDHTRHLVEDRPDFIEDQLTPFVDRYKAMSHEFEALLLEPDAGSRPPEEEEGPSGEQPPPEPEGKRSYVPMRVQVAVRDAQGGIVNEHALGRSFWEYQLDELPFSAEALGQIRTVRLESGTVLRHLTLEKENQDGERFFVQLIINVDAEQGVLDNFLQIVIACVAVGVLLALAASYLLTRRSMAPIIRSWNRQTEFVENASHELRTPLTIIQNKLETLLSTPQATIWEKADSLAVTLRETRRLSKLTGDLMTLARADSAQTLLEKETLDLDALITEMREGYGELFELENKTLRLALDYGQTLYADRGRIQELLVILLDNALKYTREGDEVVISTALQENRAVIQVADTGIGISEESRARIFDRFYREDKARSRESGGSGLGLSIAKWIVETHGGSIKALPHSPRGTVFQVKLPRG